MPDSFNGPLLHNMDYTTLDVVRNQGEAPPIPRLIHLGTTGFCRHCHDGLPRKHRCTISVGNLALASIGDLVNGVGSGAGCAIDRDFEIERRIRAANIAQHTKPKRPCILARLFRRSPK